MARQRARHASSGGGGGANGINQNNNNNSSGMQRANRSGSAPTPVRRTDGLCSRFLVEIKAGSKAYRYDVGINLLYSNNCTINTTGRIAGLARRTFYREINRKIVQGLRRKLQFQTATAYDNATTLFTASPLFLNKQQHHLFREDLDQWVLQNVGADFLGADITVEPNSAAPVLQLDRIQRPVNDSQDPNKPLRMFLEIATSEWAVDSGQYTSLPNGKLFSTNPQRHIDAEEGVIIRPGLRKGVSIVENNGHPTPCVDIEVKFSPFFKAQSLLATAKTIHSNPSKKIQYEDISDTISDLEVQCAYNRKITFGVGGFTEESLTQITLKPEEPNGPTLVDYYRITYRINLNNPLWCGVKNAQFPGKVFPVELLEILPHQVVPLVKMTDGLSKRLHSLNNVRPGMRYSRILTEAKGIQLFDLNNQSLSQFGVFVRLDSNTVDLEQYSKPKVSYKSNQATSVDSVTGTWRSGSLKYVDAKPATGWWAIYYPKAEDQLVEKFIGQLQSEAKLRGVFMGESKFMKKCPYQSDLNIFDNFEVMARFKVGYVLYLDSNLDRDSHAILKLAENMYGIVTQHVTLEVVQNIVEKGQRQTLENIVAKANIKFAGLNYSLAPANISGTAATPLNLANGDLLVFGMDVAHPKQPSLNDRKTMRRVGLRADSNFSVHPSVVGISGNITANPECFSGGFFYQRSRCEQVDAEELKRFVGAMLAALKRNRPTKSRPTVVLILRDGVSESQYEMAEHDELKAFRAAFTAYDPEWQPQIALMIVTKRHIKRLFEQSAPAGAENPQPFTLADERFARLGTDEMVGENLVVPHRTIKGTAKPIQTYTLVNKTPFPRDTLVMFAMSLAYHHQIVNLPTSLPQPIYQADELATRGNNNYAQFRLSFEDRLSLKTEYIGEPDSRNSQREIQVVDTAALNAILSPRDSALLERRFV